MGSSNWSQDAYANLSQSYQKKTTTQIFTNTNVNKVPDLLSPVGLKIRESRDSINHPTSDAIMVYLDQTGSMGTIPEYMIKHKLGTLMNTLIKHGVEHPQIMFGAIGDHLNNEIAPLQVGQFESGTDELDKYLTAIKIEGNGGGNYGESYLMAYLVAARHTSIDCFEKRGLKGFLFTIGDEATHKTLDVDALKHYLGYEEASALTVEQLLAEAQRMYHVFHIHVNTTGHRNDPYVLDSWKKILGERLLILEDQDAVAEVIASTVAVLRGKDLADVVKDFDPSKAIAVKNALVKLDSSIVKKTDTGIVQL